jgi:hypothetical protein
MIIMFKGEDGVFPFLPIGYPTKKGSIAITFQ